MSIQQVLENIKYFIATVLRNAYFDDDWDREAIESALNWADYCEKLYERAKGKPIEEKFNNYVKTLSSEPTSVVPNANFDFLKHSTKALNLALLQNPYLSRELVGIIIQQNQTDDSFKDELLKLVQLKSSFLTLEEWSKFRVSKQSQDCLNQTITAKLALTTLKSRFLESESTSTKEAVITNFFSQSTTSPEQLLSLVHICCLGGSDCSLVQKTLMELLLSKITGGRTECDSRISGIIWKLEPKMLSKLSVIYPSFCKVYCDYIAECGQLLQLCYTTAGVKWKPREERDGISYNDLVCHFTSLSAASNKLQKHVVKTLQDLASKSIYSVWEDLLNEVIK